MPLDPDERNHADLLFLAKSAHIHKQYRIRKAETKVDVERRGLRGTGEHISALTRDRADSVQNLIAARAESLLETYATAGLIITDLAVTELTSELTKFAEDQAVASSKSLEEDVTRIVERNTDPDAWDKWLREFRRMAQDNVPQLLREIRIKRSENVLAEKRALKTYAAGVGKTKDVFISHASEDKAFVRGLAEALMGSGLTVWFDETNLTIGDSLRRQIDAGLATSRFGIVVLSHAFFAKEWPQQELNGLFAREIAGIKVILPVWHDLTKEEVTKYSPILSDRLAGNSSEAPDELVRKLRIAMGLDA